MIRDSKLWRVVDLSLHKKVIMKNGMVVIIKRLSERDYTRDNNYEFVHNWLSQVSTYLSYDFHDHDLERNKQQFYISLNNAENIFIGALYDMKIVAQAKLNVNILSSKEEHIGQWSIMVHPDFQNIGLGTHILHFLEVIAKKIGLKKLEAEYVEGNIPAESLYIRKLGYTIEGRKSMGFKMSDDTFVDKIVIGKIL